jgi:hypothetical protein
MGGDFEWIELSGLAWPKKTIAIPIKMFVVTPIEFSGLA